MPTAPRHLRQGEFLPRNPGPGPRPSNRRVNTQPSSAPRKETGIPLVATNDCHYLHHEDAHAQEVLLCIQTGKTMSDANRMKFATDQFYFKTAEEMAKSSAKCPKPFPAPWTSPLAATSKSIASPTPFPEFQGPRGPHSRHLLRKNRPRRFCSTPPVPRASGAAEPLRHPLAEYENRLYAEIK